MQYRKKLFVLTCPMIGHVKCLARILVAHSPPPSRRCGPRRAREVNKNQTSTKQKKNEKENKEKGEKPSNREVCFCRKTRQRRETRVRAPTPRLPTQRRLLSFCFYFNSPFVSYVLLFTWFFFVFVTLFANQLSKKIEQLRCTKTITSVTVSIHYLYSRVSLPLCVCPVLYLSRPVPSPCLVPPAGPGGDVLEYIAGARVASDSPSLTERRCDRRRSSRVQFYPSLPNRGSRRALLAYVGQSSTRVLPQVSDAALRYPRRLDISDI